MKVQEAIKALENVIPQVSFSSTSPGLTDDDNPTKYPSFFRTCPTDMLQTQAAASLLGELNYENICVVHTDLDGYSVKGASAFVDAAVGVGMTIISTIVTLDDPSADDAEEGKNEQEPRRLQETPTNYI